MHKHSTRKLELSCESPEINNGEQGEDACELELSDGGSQPLI